MHFQLFFTKTSVLIIANKSSKPQQERENTMIKKNFTAIILLTGLLFYSPAAFAQDEIVNLNEAGIEELTELFEYLELPSELAQAIIDYRKANGNFQTPDQLTKVPGMTQDFLEEINPVQKDGDVIYDPDAEPALAPSKC